ncbi:MAG TPA: chemotaxis protein CheW [Planctomycetota bacterium]|jgi:purine-binding chemotaxis protein CheW
MSLEASSFFLIVTSHGCLCALPLAAVRETLRPLPVKPLAGMPSFVRGVAIIRGLPTPVVDLDHLLADAELPAQQAATRAPDAASRFVTLNVAGRPVALAVSIVNDVRALSAADLSGLPPLLQRAQHNAISTLGTLDHELVVVLEETRIISEELWHKLEAPGTKA